MSSKMNIESKLFLFYQDDNYFLSNFYPHVVGRKTKYLNIRYDNQTWPTSEHLYQALKFCADTPLEREWRELIRTSTTPTMAKHLGHQFTSTKYEWQRKLTTLVHQYKPHVRLAGDLNDDVFCRHIMKVAIMAKFEIAELRMQLLSTKPAILGEKTHDRWGYYGKNWLGEILMDVRDNI